MSVKPAWGGGRDQPLDVAEVGQVGEAGYGGCRRVAIQDGTLEADPKGGLDMGRPVIDEQHRRAAATAAPIHYLGAVSWGHYLASSDAGDRVLRAAACGGRLRPAGSPSRPM